MTASIVARVVRIPLIAAVVVAPMLASACSNDPMSPRAQGPQLSTSAASDSAGRTTSNGGSVPWFDSQTDASAGGSVPWF